MAYTPPTIAEATPTHAHVFMDILQPTQGLARKYRDQESDRLIYARRREKQGGDDFQIQLEEQWQWQQNRLDTRKAELQSLRDALTPEYRDYLNYLES